MAIPLLAECVVSLVFTRVLMCHQQLQHACCVAALSRAQERWPFLSRMPSCNADVSHLPRLHFTNGALGLPQVLGSYQFQAAAAPLLATLRGVPLSNCRDLTTRLSDYSRLRHLHAAGGSPALRFAELPPSLRVGVVHEPSCAAAWSASSDCQLQHLLAVGGLLWPCCRGGCPRG